MADLRPFSKLIGFFVAFFWREFIFADLRFFVFCWKLIFAISRQYQYPALIICLLFSGTYFCGSPEKAAQKQTNSESHDWLGLIKSYTLAFLCTNESKLRVFQFKLLHRKLATNYFLFKIGIKSNDQCSFCKESSETRTTLPTCFSIMHF